MKPIFRSSSRRDRNGERGLTSWGNLVDGGHQSDDPSVTQAHVNIVIFYKYHNFIDVAYVQVSDAAEQLGVSPDRQTSPYGVCAPDGVCIR